jgi:hypothetical protein
MRGREFDVSKWLALASAWQAPKGGPGMRTPAAASFCTVREKHLSYLACRRFHGKLSSATGRSSPSAFVLLMCSARRRRAPIPNARKRLEMYD